MGSLKPLPQAMMTAQRLRDCAKQLILEAEALEAVHGSKKPISRPEFLFTSDKIKRGEI